MSWSLPAFEALARLIGRRTGLTFEQRQDSAEQGMRQAMARARLTDPAAYVNVIATNEQALNDLVSELTVGETYFFREPLQFQRIRVGLSVLRRQRGPDHTLRVWSAGCASGEEAYSLAIILDQEGFAEKAHILGTDISHKALARARRGVYGAWSLRGDGAKAALPYLQAVGKELRLAEKIRRRVTFEHLNLALDTCPSLVSGTWGMDLILCRNVLIYFDRDTIRQVARRLYQALAPGGWLIAASSDPPLWEDAPFEVLANAEEGLVYQRPLNRSQSWEPEAPAREGDRWQEPSPLLARLATEEETKQPWQPEAPAREDLPQEPVTSVLLKAQQLFDQGDYAAVVRLLEDEADQEAASLRIRAWSNLDVAGAEQACARATARHPLSAELHYVQAVLLLNLGREEEAARALRRVLYLNRMLAVAHFTLGTVLRGLGERAGARRAFRNARDLCLKRPAEEALPLGEGEMAGRLAELAASELALLQGAS